MAHVGGTWVRIENHYSPMSAKKTTRKPTILVVDDSPEMLRYFRFLLELESYHVETANNGMEALQQLNDGANPDVILLDLEMPYLDGMRTLQCLQSIRPGQKIIMCSGVSDPRVAKQAKALGADAYLSKPVQHLYLTAALERCLEPRTHNKVLPKPTVIPFRSTPVQ